MKKILLASTISLLSLAAVAEPVQVQQIPADQVYTEGQPAPSIYQKTTVVRYNVPTCKNCQTTTTVNRVVTGTEPAIATVPCPTGGCAAAPAPIPARVQKPKSCVFDNHKYAIGNPLFVLKEGQFSSNTIFGVWKRPKKVTHVGTIDNISGGWQGWDANEQVMYGLTDWLSVKLQGGYSAFRPKKSTWRLDPTSVNKRVPHDHSYEGTVGLQAHALDTCNFDLIVGVDATWGKATYQKGNCKDSQNYKLVTPYAIMGGQITKYVTPYVQAGYTFAVNTKKEVTDDAYMIQPGFYIQPSKYWAIHPYIIKPENEKPQWNLALDFYPYQNLVIGVQGSARSFAHDPAEWYGLAGHIKMTF